VLRALGSSEARIAQLVQAGLVVTNDSGRRYDRFRDRIMFPIRNSPRGQVIGFGGRVLDSGEPKYLNSPETPVFHKGHELYGLYEALQAHKSPERLLVVEGYMDVIALAQFGVTYGVATLGTATTADQAYLNAVYDFHWNLIRLMAAVGRPLQQEQGAGDDTAGL